MADDVRTTEPVEGKRLFGAAAAAAAKKAATANPLDALLENLDAAYEEAEAEVARAKEALATAEQRFRTVQAIRSVRDGTFQLTPPTASPAPTRRGSSSGPRAPRAEGQALRVKIEEVVRGGDSDGVVIADILAKVAPDSDEKAKQKVRNQAAAMVKAGKLNRHQDGFYTLSVG